MTAPMFWAAPGSLRDVAVGALVSVDGPEGRHAVRVRRMAPGEPVQLADGSGTVVVGQVAAADQDVLTVLVQLIQRPVQEGPRLTLVQALAKGGRDEQAIEAATELGVDTIVPWAAERSVVQWRADRAARAHRKWETVVTAAAKQSRRADVPVVEQLVTTAALVGQISGARVLALHEAATTGIGELELDGLRHAERLMLIVGPEGGISDRELTALTERGADAVRLGPGVLRSSTAGPAAIAVLSARLRW
ncbi:16S rRNA (uracil(1498)-N(3))-methyltransferase [Dermatophilaceae bacterium Sec6.4]